MSIAYSLPFLKVKGESELRFDLRDLKLFFLGKVIWIREFYIILIAIIFILFLIITITVIFGKVWCGWLCPQTILLDLSKDILSIISKKRSKFVFKILLLPVSALASLGIIWYFIPPLQMMEILLKSNTITGFFIFQWFIIYIVLAFIGRNFCKGVCPYSVFQDLLSDNKTVTIYSNPDRLNSCIGCNMCIKACPLGIYLKNGLKRELIYWAEGIDACSSISQKKGSFPIIEYRGKILRPKAFIFGSITALVGLVFLVLVYIRPELNFIITRNPLQIAKGINSYTYSIQNNGNRRLILKIDVEEPFIIIGRKEIRVPPYSTIHKRIVVRAKEWENRVRFVLKGSKVNIERETNFL
jgi:polyferredoxin